LVNDRRFAGRGFKRQVPIGPHIADFVSFPLKCVIDLVPENEVEVAARTRADKLAYLTERDYRVVEVSATEVEKDVAMVLTKVLDVIAGLPPTGPHKARPDAKRRDESW